MRTSSGAVLVTGASSGMGKACALRLSQAGYTVFAGVRKERDAQILKQEGVSRLVPVILDVTDDHTIANAYQMIHEMVGAIGLVGLVNNAGIGITAPIELVPLEELRRQFDVNVIGQVAVIQAFSEKCKISVVVIDMHRPYRDLIQEHLPQAHTIIDKFHVLRQLGEVVERMRKDVRASLTDRQRRTLMHDRFLLHKRHQDLSEPQLLILESWLGQFPNLAAVYWRKEEFYTVYNAQTCDDALERYAAWQRSVEESGVQEVFQSFLDTVERWREWIFAYFTHRYTGGLVEGLNGLIRSQDRAGRGYSFAVLRARMLYGQHLIRQTRRPKPKTGYMLEEERVDSLVDDSKESTLIQLPLPL